MPSTPPGRARPMESGHDGDECTSGTIYVVVGQGVQIIPSTKYATRHMLHHRKRHADYLRIATAGDRTRYQRPAPVQGFHHSVLTRHAVCAEGVSSSSGGPTQNPTVVAIGDSIGEIGAAAGDQIGAQRLDIRHSGAEETLRTGQSSPVAAAVTTPPECAARHAGRSTTDGFPRARHKCGTGGPHGGICRAECRRRHPMRRRSAGNGRSPAKLPRR